MRKRVRNSVRILRLLRIVCESRWKQWNKNSVKKVPGLCMTPSRSESIKPASGGLGTTGVVLRVELVHATVHAHEDFRERRWQVGDAVVGLLEAATELNPSQACLDVTLPPPPHPQASALELHPAARRPAEVDALSGISIAALSRKESVSLIRMQSPAAAMFGPAATSRESSAGPLGEQQPCPIA